jgi:hypothetical protein
LDGFHFGSRPAFRPRSQLAARAGLGKALAGAKLSPEIGRSAAARGQRLGATLLSNAAAVAELTGVKAGASEGRQPG